MIKLNVHEAKAHLSRYLPMLEAGEVIILCKRNVPIAEIRRLPRKSHEPRPIGLDKGQVIVHDSFFEPLPDWLLESFGE